MHSLCNTLDGEDKLVKKIFMFVICILLHLLELGHSMGLVYLFFFSPSSMEMLEKRLSEMKTCQTRCHPKLTGIFCFVYEALVAVQFDALLTSVAFFFTFLDYRECLLDESIR